MENNLPDIITELGELGFASRLKRLSERLMRDVSQLYHQLDVEFEARWFAILFTLNRKSPMAVTELAQSLKLTHTAVNQLASEMLRKELLISAKGRKDERQRLLSISPKGQAVVDKLVPVWEQIREATRELISATDCNVLSALEKMEQELERQDMYERVWIRLNGRPPGQISICEYQSSFKKHFRSLNTEWLEKYFQIEPEDEKVLNDPNTKIIRAGGAVLFACLDEKVVGTVAIIRHRNGVFELAKMAVTEKYQGLGIGKQLLKAALKKAGEFGATEIFLQTSPRLNAANYLYQKLGFQQTETDALRAERYARKTFTMRMDLSKV